MRNLKQKPGSKNCVAIVAAMAFDCEVDEFERFAGECGEGYSDSDFVRFALSKKCLVGMPFSAPVGDELTLRMSVYDTKAYVIVKGENGLHAVYWDGQYIYDPNPTNGDRRDLKDYKILFWYPILKLVDK